MDVVRVRRAAAEGGTTTLAEGDTRGTGVPEGLAEKFGAGQLGRRGGRTPDVGKAGPGGAWNGRAAPAAFQVPGA